MKSSRLIIFLVLVLGLVILAVGLPAYLYNRPLGSSLDLKQPAAAAANQNSIPAAQKQVSSRPDSNAAPPAQKGVCNETGRVNMLMLGQNLPETFGRGSDAIRLMVIDYDQPWVGVLAMPPDILVETRDLPDIESTTLTNAFWEAIQPPPQGEPAAVRKATQVVAQALLDNFLYDTEKYLTLNEPVFVDMVDTLNGVVVNVPVTVDATSEGYGIYEQGDQLMNGITALNYIRMTINGEWARFARQNQVLKGLQAELVLPENWDETPALINDFFNLLTTDLSPRDLRNLNCMLLEVGDNITLYQITPEMVTTRPDGVMIPDVEAIRAVVQDLEQGP